MVTIHHFNMKTVFTANDLIKVYGEPSGVKPEVKAEQQGDTGLGGFATGVGKGVVSTAKGIAQIGGKIGETILPGFKSAYSEQALQQDAQQGGTLGKLLSEENLKAKSTAESIGKGTERIAEFLLPAGQISKASNAVDTLIQGGGFIKGAGRVLAKGAIEGAGNAAITLAQTGGDLEEAGKTALIAGGLKAGLSTIGEVANAAKLPERLYSTIFKNSSDDMLQELKSGALDDWQKTNPKEFADLVSKGIIKTGKDGNIVLNETLAKEALDRGLKGSLKNMATETVKNTYRLEDKVKQAINTYTGDITGKPILLDLPEKSKLVSLLDEVATDYKTVGGNISEQATNLSNIVKGNRVDANSALELRRFLDGMRVRSSFNPGQKLSQTQANFKYFADATRKELSKIPGVKDLMNEYRFNIEALDTIAKEAAKQGNTQLLSLIDSMLLSGGIAGQAPAAAATSIVARRALKNAPLLTNAAQKIKNIGKSSLIGETTRGILGSSNQ